MAGLELLRSVSHGARLAAALPMPPMPLMPPGMPPMPMPPGMPPMPMPPEKVYNSRGTAQVRDLHALHIMVVAMQI